MIQRYAGARQGDTASPLVVASVRNAVSYSPYGVVSAAIVALCIGILGVGRLPISATEANAPVVHCGWVLATAKTQTEVRSYGPADERATGPVTQPPLCAATDGGAVAASVAIASRSQLFIDLRGGRTLELWAAVSAPADDVFGSGAGTVMWTIRGPLGSTTQNITAKGRSCDGSSERGPMWSASSTVGGNGVFAPEGIENEVGEGLWTDCRQGRIRLFHGDLKLNANSPCGTYRVNAQAIVGEQMTSLQYRFEVICTNVVALDVVNLAWELAPGETSTVRGDRDPATSDKATITNQGTEPMEVGVVFSSMADPISGQAIDRFAAMLTRADGERTGISALQAGVEGWFPGAVGVVCPGESAQLDVMVSAPADLALGSYYGSLHVVERKGGTC